MSEPGFCTSCGRAAPADAIRCDSCHALLPAGDQSASPRRMARDLETELGPGFQVTDELAHGGYARVFRVRDIAGGRWLAAKVIRPEMVFSSNALERFRREAASVARLSHPNIVPILSLVSPAGGAGCLMPLIEGETLHARVRRDGALPLDIALGVARDVAAALDAAHQAGIVHRDVKPDNILLEAPGGRALLTDFGIAKVATGGPRITRTGQALGTPQYVSPEQAAGEHDVDARADVYSLGVVVYEMLAGTPPYTSVFPEAVFALHVAAPVPDLRRARQVPDAIAAAVTRALAKRPEDRWPTAGAFVVAMAGASS